MCKTQNRLCAAAVARLTSDQKVVYSDLIRVNMFVSQPLNSLVLNRRNHTYNIYKQTDRFNQFMLSCSSIVSYSSLDSCVFISGSQGVFFMYQTDT